MKDNAREDKVEEARDQVEGRRWGRHGRCGESECRRKDGCPSDRVTCNITRTE